MSLWVCDIKEAWVSWQVDCRYMTWRNNQGNSWVISLSNKLFNHECFIPRKQEQKTATHKFLKISPLTKINDCKCESKTKQLPSLFFFACLTMEAREALYNFLAYNSLYFLSAEVCKSNKEDSCLSGFRGFKQRLVLSEGSPPRNTTLTACGLSVYVCACLCVHVHAHACLTKHIRYLK